MNYKKQTMAKQWKQVQRADSDFAGNVTGKVNNVVVSNVYTTSNKPTKTDVGLGNVTNESKSTMFANPAFTGTPSGITKSHVGLSAVENFSKASILGGTFTGDIGGTSAADIKAKAVAGEAAKSAVDGSTAITMVGGSLSIGTPASGVYPFAVDTSGNLKIKNDEFQALADGTVNCKGSFTINQDSSSNSKILLSGSGNGTAEVEVQGANPTFDLGGSSPLGTSTLYIKRGGTNNQARINFRTGTGATTFAIGNSNNSGINDQFAIATRSLWSSGTAPERALSFDADGKIGMYSNSKTVAGFTFGSDGTNKHVYVKDGSLGINTAPSDSYKLSVDNGISRFNRGNSSGDIAQFRGQNAAKMTVKTTGVDIVGALDIVGGIETSGNAFIGNHLTIDGGDLNCYNDATVAGSLDAASYTGNGSGLSNIVPGNNSVTLAKMADNSVRVAELDTNNSPVSGQTLAYVPAGTGLSWINPVDVCHWQWNSRWYTRYDDYFYPNSSYGMNEPNWSTSSSSAKTTWLAYHMPPFVAPFAFTLTECYLRGAPSASATFELILKKGTPSWANSSSATTIANIGTLETLSCTSGRKNELGQSALSVSVAKGDILVPQLRRTTSNTSSYIYFLGVFSIVGQRTI